MSLLLLLRPQSGGGSPDVTVALSGQAVTCSAGTLGITRDLALSGQAATASAGTLTPVLSFGLTGSAVTASAGTLTPAMAFALLGEAVAASAGTLVYGEVEGAATPATQGGFARYGDPYRPRKEDVHRLKRLMGFESVRETQRFIKQNPEPARMALAVFEITADPDQLIEAVLQTEAMKEAAARLKQAADAEALRKLRAFYEDEALVLLLILAAAEV